MLPASGALHNGLPGALLLAACVELVVAPQFRHLGVVQLDRPPYSSCWSLSHFGFLLKTQDDSDRLECATFEKCLKNCVSWALKTAPREEFQIPVNRGNSLESVYRFPRGQLCSWGRPDGRGQNSVVGGPIYSFQKSNYQHVNFAYGPTSAGSVLWLFTTSCDRNLPGLGTGVGARAGPLPPEQSGVCGGCIPARPPHSPGDAFSRSRGPARLHRGSCEGHGNTSVLNYGLPLFFLN